LNEPGAVIQLYLVDGTPSGLTTIEKLGWTGVGISCNKSRFLDSADREEFDRSGIYILLGQDGESGSDRIYVGEGDVVRDRLKSHVTGKDFWERLVTFTSNDSRLNKAHIRYLESRLIAIAIEAKRVALDNGNKPSPPPLSEADRAYAESFLREMLTILPVLQITAFESPRQIESTGVETRDSDLLFFSTGDVSATWYVSSGGFTVVGGSGARESESPSTDGWVISSRRRLMSAGILMQSGSGSLKFTQDYEFGSPSAAAATVSGGNTNGRTAWKNASGQTLKLIQDEAISD